MPLSRCALLGAALVLSACATTRTPPERPVAPLAERLKGAGEAQASCYAGLRADPSTTRVVAYTVVGADDAATGSSSFSSHRSASRSSLARS